MSWLYWPGAQEGVRRLVWAYWPPAVCKLSWAAGLRDSYRKQMEKVQAAEQVPGVLTLMPLLAPVLKQGRGAS